MNDYFNRLETQLANLTKQGAHLGHPARDRRRVWGALVPVLALAGAIAVAAVFLLSVKPHQAAQEPALRHRGITPREGIYPLGAVPTLQQLRDNFAVLRRPQTASDRSWSPRCGCAGAARQLNGLTRLAVTLPGGYRVVLEVEQFILGGQLNMAAGSYVMNLDIVNRRGNSSSEAFGPNVGYAVSPLSWGGLRARQGQRHGSQAFASVVPDGVAAVSWTLGCSRVRPAAQCAGVRAHTFTVPVINNVAARQLSGIGNCLQCGFAAHVVWRSADGHVVASFPQGFGNLPAPPFVAGGRGRRVLRVLLPNAVGAARLGDPSSSAIQTITRLLGPPADANVATGGCGIDHESVWTSPAVADPLTIFEKAGRFAGYQYGAPVSEIGLQRGPGAVMATPRGLTLADTIHAAGRLYASGFATSASHGVGRWRAAADGGTLYGFVLPTTYPLRVVTDKNPAATIDAGDTGCPPRGNQ